MFRLYRILCVFLMLICSTVTYGGQIPILCYHNFNPSRPGSMNLTPATFEKQIQWLNEHGFHIIPLQEAVSYLLGERKSLPSKPIVITIDDGWQSVYTYLLPIAKKYQLPITLFIYPGTISEGKNSLTWAELSELQKTGLFDIQSHTLWHPNFKQEKKKRSPAAFEQFVKTQLVKAKSILEEKLNKKITLLAWPFGIYNAYLEQEAANAGYKMAFTIDARPATQHDRAMAQPRYMIIQSQSMQTFAGIANRAQNTTS